jgi:putative alpha-1,2-mannosidase
MAKAVADTNSGSNQGGFTLDGSPVTGFSTMHDSGTGGSPSLGNFALFPYTICQNDTIDGCTYPKKARPVGFDSASVKASPGYFGLTLSSGIKVDMTTTQHTSLFRFQFPAGQPSSPLILMDLTDLSDSRQDNATIAVDEKTGRMTGSGRFVPSFGSGTYTLYFCADFKSSSELRDNGIFVGSRASADVKQLKISRSINGYPLPVRLLYR